MAMEETERQCNERKEVILNPPRDSQSRQENQAQRPHGGMVHIAQFLRQY